MILYIHCQSEWNRTTCSSVPSRDVYQWLTLWQCTQFKTLLQKLGGPSGIRTPDSCVQGKRIPNYTNSPIFVEAGRIELPTLCLQSIRSPSWAMPPCYFMYIVWVAGFEPASSHFQSEWTTFIPHSDNIHKSWYSPTVTIRVVPAHLADLRTLSGSAACQCWGAIYFCFTGSLEHLLHQRRCPSCSLLSFSSVVHPLRHPDFYHIATFSQSGRSNIGLLSPQ